MKLAIENFANLYAPKKVLMLGAMAELGEESLDEHKQIIELIQKNKWSHVVLVGGDYLRLSHPYLSFSTSLEAKQWFNDQSFEKTFLLIKGSRSMKMELIIE
jgi:UDP-N-acetylmuramoyl-tripeptide--D-alanyl-D-alanine ligase